MKKVAIGLLVLLIGTGLAGATDISFEQQGMGQIAQVEIEKTPCSKCNTRGEIRCSTCNGTGKTKCLICFGSGYQISVGVNEKNSVVSTQVSCSRCSGSGYQECSSCSGSKWTFCPYCNGQGYFYNF